MASRLLRRSLFQKLRNVRNYSHDHHHPTAYETDVAHRATMDFLPKAQGSWKELNDKRQTVNNATLGLGLVLFLSAFVGTYSLGFYDNLYFKAPYDKINKDFPGAKFTDAN